MKGGKGGTPRKKNNNKSLYSNCGQVKHLQGVPITARRWQACACIYIAPALHNREHVKVERRYAPK